MTSIAPSKEVEAVQERGEEGGVIPNFVVLGFCDDKIQDQDYFFLFFIFF